MRGNRRAVQRGGGRARLNGYLISWLVLAAFAMGYIGVAAVRPDLLAGVLPFPDRNGDQVAGGRGPADVVDEIDSLRKWVNDLQHELSATKSTVQSQSEQNRALMQRLAAAEERLQAQTQPAGAAAQPHAAAASAPVARSQVAAVVKAAEHAKVAAHKPAEAAADQHVAAADAGAAPVAETRPLRVINTTTTSDITTGSVQSAPAVVGSAAQAAAQPAAAAKAAVGTRAIEIADAESLDGLRTRWSDLATQNPTVLKSLSPRYRISANGSASPFTLLAGPFASNADAARACAQLRTSGGINCRVADFTGNGL